MSAHTAKMSAERISRIAVAEVPLHNATGPNTQQSEPLLAQSGGPLRCNDLSATRARADIAERSA